MVLKDIKKLAKLALRVLIYWVPRLWFFSLDGGEKLHQCRHGEKGSWPVTFGSPTPAEMIDLRWV